MSTWTAPPPERTRHRVPSLRSRETGSGPCPALPLPPPPPPAGGLQRAARYVRGHDVDVAGQRELLRLPFTRSATAARSTVTPADAASASASAATGRSMRVTSACPCQIRRRCRSPRRPSATACGRRAELDFESVERDARQLPCAPAASSRPLMRAFASSLRRRRPETAPRARRPEQREGLEHVLRDRRRPPGSDASTGSEAGFSDTGAAIATSPLTNKSSIPPWPAAERSTSSAPASDRARAARTRPGRPARRARAGRAQLVTAAFARRARARRSCRAAGPLPASGLHRRARASRSRFRRARRSCPRGVPARPATPATAPAPTAGPRRWRDDRARCARPRCPTRRHAEPAFPAAAAGTARSAASQRQRHVAFEARRPGRQRRVDRDGVDQLAARADGALRLGRDLERAAAQRAAAVADVGERHVARQRRRARLADDADRARDGAGDGQRRADESGQAARSGTGVRRRRGPAGPRARCGRRRCSVLVAGPAERQRSDEQSLDPPTRSVARAGSRTRSPSTVSALRLREPDVQRDVVGVPRTCARNVSAPPAKLAAEQAIDLDAVRVSASASRRGDGSQPRRRPVAQRRCAPRRRGCRPTSPASRAAAAARRPRAAAPARRTTVAPGGGRADRPGEQRQRARVLAAVLARANDQRAAHQLGVAEHQVRRARASRRRACRARTGRSAGGSSARGEKRVEVDLGLGAAGGPASRSLPAARPRGDASDRRSRRKRPASGSAVTLKPMSRASKLAAGEVEAARLGVDRDAVERLREPQAHAAASLPAGAHRLPEPALRRMALSASAASSMCASKSMPDCFDAGVMP